MINRGFRYKRWATSRTVILDILTIKKALDNTLIIAESRHGWLTDKPALKSAMDYWPNQAARIGVTGAYSPHSLRYAFALSKRNYQLLFMTVHS